MGSTFLGGMASSKYGLKNVLYLGLISMGLGAVLALYVSSAKAIFKIMTETHSSILKISSILFIS